VGGVGCGGKGTIGGCNIAPNGSPCRVAIGGSSSAIAVSIDDLSMAGKIFCNGAGAAAARSAAGCKSEPKRLGECNSVA
jgi:hypothetical protein